LRLLGPLLAAALVLAGLGLIGPPAGASEGAEGASGAAAASRPARADEVVQGRVLVGFEPGAGAGTRTAALRSVDGVTKGSAGRVTVVGVDPGSDERATARRLAAQPGVAFAEPDVVRRVQPASAAASQRAALEAASAAAPRTPVAVNGICPDCWQLGPRPGIDVASLHAAGYKGAAGSVVAVVDTGVNIVGDLNGQVLARRWCKADATCVADPAFLGGHGTMVATLIAGRDDLTGITGVAPGAKIKSWRAMDPSGVLPASAVVAALTEIAADPAVDVVNLSFGGASPSTGERQAIDAVLRAGKSVVAAAGNEGGYWPSFPAAYPGVLSVGAVDANGTVAGFSAYGKLDVVAPGVCVPASAPPGSTSDAGCPASPRNAVVSVTGTSFASPLVAGLLALDRAATPRRSRLGIEGTADHEPPEGLTDPKRWGYGLADGAAWHASKAAGAAPYVVVEPSTQLLRPSAESPAVWNAYVQSSSGAITPPSLVSLAGLTLTSLVPVLTEPGLFLASAPSGPQTEPGTQRQTATASTLSGPVSGGAWVRVLRPDDQAPGTSLDGAGPWTENDHLTGAGTPDTAADDLDDVRGIQLAAGQRVTVKVDGPTGGGLRASIYSPATTDVFTQLTTVPAASAGTPGIVATGPPADATGDSSVTFTAALAGRYLVDVYAFGFGAGGDYTLTVTRG
jgi:hypothetical protein